MERQHADAEHADDRAARLPGRRLTGNRQKIGVDDPRLDDRVADNIAKNDITESEALLFGRNFGIVSDIRTSPAGSLYVVSLSKGTVYEIASARAGRGRDQ